MRRRDFLLSLGTAGAAALLPRCARPPLPPLDRVGEAFDVCAARPERTLSILTWNIFMMPPWVRESPRNDARAAAIAGALAGETYDIVCLQKVFDDGARALLSKALTPSYPFQYGPLNHGPSVELNGGVWVLSRHALTNLREIEFSDCSSIECLSRKGALLLSGRCGVRPFHLIVTHLQGEEGNAFTPKNERVRLAQMKALRDELITPNVGAGVPFILCGDFGTPRFTADGTGETAVYRSMLATLGAENGGAPRITLDETPARAGGNDVVKDGAGRKNELDYILVRPGSTPLQVERERRVFRHAGWDDDNPGRQDLSYRYAVAARVHFGVP